MIHASNYKPRCYPFNGTAVSTELDRIQDIRGALTLNREKIKEVGRDGLVDWRKKVPTLKLTLSQLEYGSMELFNQLANSALNDASLSETDFKTSMIDICGYKTDDNGTFLGTVWYPNLRTESFSVSIGDPDAMIQRTINLTGEDEITLLNDQKYLIVKNMVAVGAASNEAFIISDSGTSYPDPVEDEDNSGQYLHKVVQYDLSLTTATELEYTTGYTYDPALKTVTIVGATEAGDVLKFYWAAATYITGIPTFTNNDVNPAVISADSCDIWLETSTRVYKLQSVNIDVGFTRTDYKEIGNSEIVQRGVKDTVITITLGRILEDYTIEEILRDKAGLAYGKIDPRLFADDIKLEVKLYTDKEKGTFAMKYVFTDLSPASLDAGTPVDDYVTRGNTLEGESFLIKSVDN